MAARVARRCAKLEELIIGIYQQIRRLPAQLAENLIPDVKIG
jgi:hypothetical protein